MRLLELRKTNPELWSRCDLLMDNLDIIRQTEDWARQVRQPGVACWDQCRVQEACVRFLTEDCSAELEPEDIHRALGMFRSNSCNMAGFRGRGLFPTFSLINHSCVRNARHIVNSTKRTIEVSQ